MGKCNRKSTWIRAKGLYSRVVYEPEGGARKEE